MQLMHMVTYSNDIVTTHRTTECHFTEQAWIQKYASIPCFLYPAQAAHQAPANKLSVVYSMKTTQKKIHRCHKKAPSK